MVSTDEVMMVCLEIKQTIHLMSTWILIVFFRILLKKIKMDLPAGEVGIENERPDCVTSASCVCVQ